MFLLVNSTLKSRWTEKWRPQRLEETGITQKCREKKKQTEQIIIIIKKNSRGKEKKSGLAYIEISGSFDPNANVRFTTLNYFFYPFLLEPIPVNVTQHFSVSALG